MRGGCRGSISGRSSSSRRFRSTRKQPCGGCQLHVTDRQAFKPVRTAVELIDEFHRQDPSHVRLAGAAVRVRARQDADRHPLRAPTSCGRRSRPERRAAHREELGHATRRRSGVFASRSCCTRPRSRIVLASRASRASTICADVAVRVLARRSPATSSRRRRRLRCACPRAATRPRSADPASARCDSRGVAERSSEASCGRS